MKKIIGVLLLLCSTPAISGPINMFVEFSATNFSGPAPQATINGSLTWLYDDSLINSFGHSSFSDNPLTLTLSVGDHIYESDDVTMLTLFRFGEFSALDLGANLNGTHRVTGNTNDFFLGLCNSDNCLSSGFIDHFRYSIAGSNEIFVSNTVTSDITFTPVPVPSGMLMFPTAFLLFGLLRKNKFQYYQT